MTDTTKSTRQSPILTELLLAPALPELRNALTSGRLSDEQFCNFWRRSAAQADLRGKLDLLAQLLQLLDEAPARTTDWGNLLSHQYSGLLRLNEGSFERALYHFQLQRQFAERLFDPTELALAHLDLAQANLYMLNLNETREQLQQAEYWAGASHEPALQVMTLNRQAELAAYQHLTAHSIEIATQGLELARQHRLRLEQAFALNWLGINWMYQRRLDRSEETLREALRLRQTIRDELGRAETLMNLSRLYLKLNDFTAANKAVDESLDIMSGLNNRLGIAQALYTKTVVLYRAGQTEVALEWAIKSVKARVQQGEPTRVAQAFSLLGQIYENLGNRQQALACHLRVLRLHRPGQTTPQWIELLVRASDFLLTTDRKEEHSAEYWKQAIDSYRLTMEFIERNANLNYLAPVLGRMARALLKLDGFGAIPEAGRCYQLQLMLLGDIDAVFFRPEEAIAMRAEALTGLQICASLLRRQP